MADPDPTAIGLRGNRTDQVPALASRREPLRNPAEFYRSGGFRHGTQLAPWLDRCVEEYRAFAAGRNGASLRVLDVGCGEHALLSTQVGDRADYVACDIVERTSVPLDSYFQIDLNHQSLSERLGPREFDVIFCVEVIEHLFSADALLRDIERLLASDGILILSTPNLAYYLNRLLLLFGLHPLLLENSSEVKLGRRFRFLGQGNRTEGHLRVFTYTALHELFELCGLQVLRTRGAHIWDFAPDRWIARLAPRLAPDMVLVARRRGQ
jgi:SAM-dependent methyltransferase